MTEVEPAAGQELLALLRYAAAADAGSEHPLASAIVEAARERGIALADASAFEAIPGHGVRATVEGRPVLVGAERLMVREGIDIGACALAGKALAARGRTLVYLAVDGVIWGVFGVADPLSPNWVAVIVALRARGLRVAMVTGDAVRQRAGAGTPGGYRRRRGAGAARGKAQSVRRLQEQGRKVAFVGDGINDAPALAQADVGIAVASGTQVAIEAADVTLTRAADLGALLSAVTIARRTMHTIRVNLFWAFFYNALLIPLAAGVFYPAWRLSLNPMFAGLAMGLSSVFVVSNSLRLRRVGAQPAPASAAPAPPPAAPALSGLTRGIE